MGSHLWDLLPLVLIGLLIFGPKRLPEMGASIGKTIKSFQHSMREESAESAPTSVAPTLPSATTATSALPMTPAADAQPTETPSAESARV